MQTIKIKSRSHCEIVDITRKIAETVPTNLKSGICHLFVKHTTCGITINENADPDVKTDIAAMLNSLVPWHQDFFQHFEENSAAHVKSSLLGFNVSIPVINGSLDLGRWQGIYFCEFDGPKERQITIQFIKDIACE